MTIRGEARIFCDSLWSNVAMYRSVLGSKRVVPVAIKVKHTQSLDITPSKYVYGLQCMDPRSHRYTPQHNYTISYLKSISALCTNDVVKRPGTSPIAPSMLSIHSSSIFKFINMGVNIEEMSKKKSTIELTRICYSAHSLGY